MMRRPRALSFLVLSQVLIAGGVIAFSSGPPAGFAGAPGESDCTVCHASFTLNSSASVSPRRVTSTERSRNTLPRGHE